MATIATSETVFSTARLDKKTGVYPEPFKWQRLLRIEESASLGKGLVGQLAHIAMEETVQAYDGADLLTYRLTFGKGEIDAKRRWWPGSKRVATNDLTITIAQPSNNAPQQPAAEIHDERAGQLRTVAHRIFLLLAQTAADVVLRTDNSATDTLMATIPKDHLKFSVG